MKETEWPQLPHRSPTVSSQPARSPKDHEVMCVAEGWCTLKVEAPQKRQNVEVRIKVSASGSGASCGGRARNVAVLIVSDVSGEI